MKKIWIYIAGIFTGIILTILFSMIITHSSGNDVTMFAEVGDYIDGEQFSVIQVIGTDAALAQRKYDSLIVLFVNEEGKYYYDDEIIEVPDEKCIRQVGIYQYTTNLGGYKTIPIVKIFDRE